MVLSRADVTMLVVSFLADDVAYFWVVKSAVIVAGLAWLAQLSDDFEL